MPDLIFNDSLALTELKYLETLASKFDLTLQTKLPNATFYLNWLDGRVKLIKRNSNQSIEVDFTQNQVFQRIKHNQGELLVKAINLKKYQYIWDVTAGLGTDAFILAAFGAQVTLFENNPIVACLLYDGLKRGSENKNIQPIIRHMQLIFGSITDIDLAEFSLPEVIYLDPMFPERKKSALVKKKMIFLQEMIGETNNNQNLIDLIKQLPVKKVVVKRSKLAPELGTKSPSTSIYGKSIRFDIYNYA